MKKEHYETLRSMSSEAEIWAYAEKYWDEIFPEVPREQWEAYCAVKDEVTGEYYVGVESKITVKAGENGKIFVLCPGLIFFCRIWENRGSAP